jgi:hypothetical protein
MIKYALRCEHSHQWDAWFPSISGFDDQNARGLVDCPYCGSKEVEKAPMAPAIVTSKPAKTAAPGPASELPMTPNLPVAIAKGDMGLQIPEPVRAMMAEIKERIEKTHAYVGDTFAREVRAMHDGETEQRPIYGEATAKEVRELIEDEIPVAPIPMLASPKGVKGVH